MQAGGALKNERARAGGRAGEPRDDRPVRRRQHPGGQPEGAERLQRLPDPTQRQQRGVEPPFPAQEQTTRERRRIGGQQQREYGRAFEERTAGNADPGRHPAVRDAQENRKSRRAAGESHAPAKQTKRYGVRQGRGGSHAGGSEGEPYQRREHQSRRQEVPDESRRRVLEPRARPHKSEPDALPYHATERRAGKPDSRTLLEGKA